MSTGSRHQIIEKIVGIFAGLGTILFFIGVHILRGGFKTSRSASVTIRDRHTTGRKKRATTRAGHRLTVAVLVSSALITFLIFYLNFNPENKDIANPGQGAVPLPGGHGPIPVSTYSKTRTLPPCDASLKAQVAERQKIQLGDGRHSLYVTATLCIDEEEMSAASQTHLTWPTIASYLAAFDKSVYDPESVIPETGEEKTVEAYTMKLEQIAYECLARLNENGIFFVKAISLDFLQVFKAD